jgi:ubiquinone/menaquinone biosynthesis C-methylase UbiE
METKNTMPQEKEIVGTNVEEVRSFWNANPCNANLSQAEDRRQYFQEISDRRYNGRDWHVPTVANFASYRGKNVLEIGCGIATDGLEFAKSGANYTGVDLTPHSIELAKERFGLLGMPGRFEVANAEQGLPFPDSSFDHVYSFGVIHHSPHPEKIAREIHRVLRKGGTITVMLYNRNSINYYVEIMFMRKLFRFLLLPRFMPKVVARITGLDEWKLEGHRKIWTEKKISKEEWVSMNTDGPFCPLARVYDESEAAELFKEFGNMKQEIWEFNEDHWPFVRRLLPKSTVKWIGRRWGWHRMIYGEKP